MWYECKNKDCPTKTNSPRTAAAHKERTGHEMTEEADE